MTVMRCPRTSVRSRRCPAGDVRGGRRVVITGLRRAIVTAAIVVGALVLFAAPALASEPLVGDTETFWTLDWGSGVYSQISASVRYVGEHGVIYVRDGALISDTTVNSLGAAFDTAVYPAVTSGYGSEPDPGLDGRSRVVILIYDFHRDDIDGAFDPRDIDPDGYGRSNRREMFYLNLQAVISEPLNAGALAAHEFAHLVVYYRDVMLDPSPYASSESTWLTEGFTTYAEHLSGYDTRVASQLASFTNDPGFSLTRWFGFRANYGASYAFMRYIAQRFGPEFVRALAEQPLDGAAGINAALVASGETFESFDTLFDDWVLANFLDGRPPQASPYCYEGLTVSAVPDTLAGSTPLLGSRTVNDYGTIYLDFPSCPGEAVFQVVVDGDDDAPLHAALLSWDESGVLSPHVQPLDLTGSTTAATVEAPAGYDRHTLAVWARGAAGSDASYSFRYSGAPDPPAGVQFLDMGGTDPYYQYVSVLLARGVISGKEIPVGSGLWFFAGGENVKRAQFAKMIMEATGLHTPEVDRLHDPSFSDVYPVYVGGWPQEYPYDYVEEAAALGIVNGYANGTFKPYSPITRSQLVLMITRGAIAAGSPLPLYTGSATVFVDVPPSHPRYREIMTAYSNGILNGSPGSDGKLYFRPDNPASRNHVAKMTANLLGHLDVPPESAAAVSVGVVGEPGY